MLVIYNLILHSLHNNLEPGSKRNSSNLDENRWENVLPKRTPVISIGALNTPISKQAASQAEGPYIKPSGY